jgi:hypothetical protein
VQETYEDLVELAKICAAQARATRDSEVAAALRRMAKDYQVRAAALDSGELPDIGEDV